MSESAAPTESAASPSPTAPGATFNGVAFDVAFSFQYPASWTVTNRGPDNQEGGPFVITNEANVEIASLEVRPVFSIGPCDRICADMDVTYLGEVPGRGTLGEKTYAVQTKAMDLTSRKDLQQANGWEDNVRLIVGVVGNPSDTPAEDPFHFQTLAGIDTHAKDSPLRPITFAAQRHFRTMTEAKAYTSSSEYVQLQAMMGSLEATITTSSEGGASTPTTGEPSGRK
ncbi:hypothetical protein ACFVYC_19370 [Pseudarthrobacter sp. NPDC058329]|uniref:hypothetical protein n=1 Tax=Pseudarthrobacter sp. NPDC058329 TaxID=3346448 RepID=UPI0036D8BE81